MEKRKEIGPEEVRQARLILNRYREGKANLERRVIENEQWYRMRHWECMRRGAKNQVEPTSGWLFNAIANKHAEAMDNFPRPERSSGIPATLTMPTASRASTPPACTIPAPRAWPPTVT